MIIRQSFEEGEEKLFTFVIYTPKTFTKLLMCCSAAHDMLHQQITYGMMYAFAGLALANNEKNDVTMCCLKIAN